MRRPLGTWEEGPRHRTDAALLVQEGLWERGQGCHVTELQEAPLTWRGAWRRDRSGLSVKHIQHCSISRAVSQAPEQTGSPPDSHSGIRAAGFFGSLKYLFDPSISRVRTKTSPGAIWKTSK